MKAPPFKLCITMAGAVSAGAYTAGVMDYLLETLQLWQQAKDKNLALGKGQVGYDESLPMHQVLLDVMSGSSAGGIAGTLSLMSLIDPNYTPVNSKNPNGWHNRLYQSWVTMADGSESTFAKMLRTDDLVKGKMPYSLLNTKPIDEIAEIALNVKNPSSLPAYSSKNLDLILTTTNLRGIDFKINFEGNRGGGSVITNHGGFLRYRLIHGRYKRGVPSTRTSLFYVLDPNEKEDRDFLREATLSTAAFPIGLRSRTLEISKEYIKRYPDYLFGYRKGISPIFPSLEKDFRFLSIDGGLINNEPFGVGLKVLKEKNPEIDQYDNYAVVMVDPFPNTTSSLDEPEQESNLVTVAQGMFRALRNQVMFNQDGIMEALSLADRTKFLIVPSRKELRGNELKRPETELASGAFSGFAGFLDRSLREHDFLLGRKNCQIFLRYYLAIPLDQVTRRMGLSPSPEMIDRFSFTIPRSREDGTRYFPIIPDLKVKRAFDCTYDHDQYGADALLQYPVYPRFNMLEFEKRYGQLVRRRMQYLVRDISGSWLISSAYRLFYKGKLYRSFYDLLEKELRKSGLLF